MGAYLVGAYLFSVPAFAYSDYHGLLVVPQIMGALLLAYAILDIVRDLRVEIPPEVGLYGLMGLWALFTYVLNSGSGVWGSLSTTSLIKVVLATLACAQLIKDEDDLLIALKIFVFSILFVYAQNFRDLQYLRFAGEIHETDRFAGTLANANTAAIFSITVIWASLLIVLHSRRKLMRSIFYVAPIAISLVIIYYSGSKKGMVGLGLFAIFIARTIYLRQNASSLKRGLIVLFSIGLIVLAGYIIYSSPHFSRFEQLYTGQSEGDTNRFILAGEALKLWLRDGKTFVTGVGYDNFREASQFGTYSHSTPLELLSSTGLIGFLLFMGFLVILFRRFVVLYQRAGSREFRSSAFTVLIFLTIFAIFMIAAVLHESRELMPILACLAAFGQYSMKRPEHAL